MNTIYNDMKVITFYIKEIAVKKNNIQIMLTIFKHFLGIFFIKYLLNEQTKFVIQICTCI